MAKIDTPLTPGENPRWTKKDFKHATHLPGLNLTDAVAAVRRGRGPQVKPKKVAISIRVNPKVVEYFKADGPGWQARMETVLMKASGIKN